MKLKIIIIPINKMMDFISKVMRFESQVLWYGIVVIKSSQVENTPCAQEAIT